MGIRVHYGAPRNGMSLKTMQQAIASALNRKVAVQGYRCPVCLARLALVPDLRRKSPYPWIVGVLIGFDGMCNAIAGGDPDETISSRLGRMQIRDGGRIKFWRNPLAAAINAMLDRIDRNHSTEAIGQ